MAASKVEALQQKLSQSAANLPGITKNYVDLFNGVGAATASVFKGNPDEWAKQTEDLVTRVGILAASQGIDGSQAGSVLSRAITGATGFGELAQNDIIQKNDLFRQSMLEQMQKLGVEQDKWKELTSAQRMNILTEAAKKATPDSLINRFAGTYESVTQGFMTYWFDPMAGVFGVLKKVNTKNGGLKSALVAWTETLQSLGVLGESIAQLFGFDPMAPMVMLVEFLEGFSLFIRNIAAAIKLSQFGNDANIGNLEYVRDAVLGFFNGMIDSLFTSVMNFDVGQAGGLLDSALNGFGALMQGINWTDLGMAIGAAITKTLLTLLLVLVSPGLWRALAGLGSALGGIVTGVVLGIVGAAALELGNTFSGLIKSTLDWLGSMWNGAVKLIGDFIDLLANKARGIIAPLSNFASNPVQAVASAGMNAAVEGAKAVVPGLGGALDALGAMGVFGNKEGANNIKSSDTNKPTNGNESKVSSPQAGGMLMSMAPQNQLEQPTAASMLQQPSTTNNSTKTSSSVFAPNISVTSASEANIAQNVLEVIGNAYSSFRAGMA
jgi:hypothetical protein